MTDTTQALAHIEALTGSANTPVTLQTFTDGERPNPDPLAQVMHGAISDLWPRLMLLQESGAGVVASRRNPASRSRHIPATLGAFPRHLEAG
jgi:hypothetical protein